MMLGRRLGVLFVVNTNLFIKVDQMNSKKLTLDRVVSQSLNKEKIS